MIENAVTVFKASQNGHAPEPKPRPAEENLYLTGRPSLKSFLGFVGDNAVDPPIDGDLVDEWHAAREVVRQLETEESGFADNPRIQKLGPEYEPLLVELLKDPILQNSFNTVPSQIAMVELDRLVVYQKFIDVTHANRIADRLGPAPDWETVFRTCLPFDHPQAPVKWARTGSSSYTFVSPSLDMRFLEAMELAPSHLTGYPLPGDIVGIAGVAVGFGSNFLNAVFSEGRLILNNGSHRAYALRSLGLTHVPCLVQHANSRDSLHVVASRKVREDPDAFLKAPRPSVLKDYFDPRLRKIMPVHRRLRQITVKFEVSESFIPAF